MRVKATERSHRISVVPPKYPDQQFVIHSCQCQPLGCQAAFKSCFWRGEVVVKALAGVFQ
jgi:hypothetical protein